MTTMDALVQANVALSQKRQVCACEGLGQSFSLRKAMTPAHSLKGATAPEVRSWASAPRWPGSLSAGRQRSGPRTLAWTGFPGQGH